MNKNEVLKSLKDLSKFLLVNERINSQRCVAQNIDTTKTIIENKEENNEDSNKDSNEKQN